MNDILSTTKEYLLSFLEATSMRTYTPSLLGFVHIYSFVVIIFLAVLAAIFARRMSEKKRMRLIISLGWVLAAMEIYKQLFNYYIVNDGAFDLWIIPFQLCSVPMYLCILLPFVSKKMQDTMLTFMAGFTFVSAMAALIYPADMLKPYTSLTAHGFIWHGILLFISLLIGISGMADFTWKGFLRSVLLFLILAATAVAINIATELLPSSGSIASGSYANMFYLSPYHPSYQPFVSSLEESYGRLPAMAAYISGIIALAGVADLGFRLISSAKRS